MMEEFFAPIFGGIFLIIFFTSLSILAFVFWIVMLIDCIKRNFKKDVEKIVWVIVLIFTGLIGALIYYFIIKKENRK